MEKIEIERKWLLKRLPQDLGERIAITQWYLPNGWRYRQEESWREVSRYTKLIKHPLANASFGSIEEEYEFDAKTFHEEFSKLDKSSLTKIQKIRHLVYHDGLKFEIDEFIGMNLIILEVELQTHDQIINFPENIAKEMIVELTFLKGINNRDLAE